jgi:hypothetical protein
MGDVLMGGDKSSPTLVYTPPDNLEADIRRVPRFRAKDFEMIGEIPESVVLTKPKLIV